MNDWPLGLRGCEHNLIRVLTSLLARLCEANNLMRGSGVPVTVCMQADDYRIE